MGHTIYTCNKMAPKLSCAFETTCNKLAITFTDRPHLKYNKHHQNVKKQLCRNYRYVHKKTILADGIMSRVPLDSSDFF